MYLVIYTNIINAKGIMQDLLDGLFDETLQCCKLIIRKAHRLYVKVKGGGGGIVVVVNEMRQLRTAEPICRS